MNIIDKIKSTIKQDEFKNVKKASNINSTDTSEYFQKLENEIKKITKSYQDLLLKIANLNNQSLQREPLKNKPLFLIASGPSLADMDITKLKDCYTMSFNRSYIAFKDWGFEPTYFGGLDHVVNNDNKTQFRDLILNSSIKKFFFTKDEISEEFFSSNKTYLVDINELDPEHPTFDFTKKLTVSNSGLFGLQVALGILGFKEVYLLGCDANYEEKPEGIKIINGKYISESNKDVNHFRPDYYGKGTEYNKPGAMKWHLPAWEHFYKTFVKNNTEGFKIYNCSKISKLTFFDYFDYSKILKNIEKYRK